MHFIQATRHSVMKCSSLLLGGHFSPVRFSGREEGCYYTILISYLISAVIFESDKLRVLECYWRWQKIDKNVLVWSGAL